MMIDTGERFSSADGMGKRKRPQQINFLLRPFFFFHNKGGWTMTNKRGQFLEKIAYERAVKSLKERHQAFAREHANDTDQQLLDYVAACAKRLGHSPDSCEVIGGKFISDRFGLWINAIRLAGLEEPGKAPKFENRRIFKDEVQWHKNRFLDEKREMKEHRQRIAEEKQAEKNAEREQRAKETEEFIREHGGDSDEQLVAYLRQCARALGHTPYRGEVKGSEFIKERFGGWSVALVVAGLELPKDMKPPKQNQLHRYNKLIKTLSEQFSCDPDGHTDP